MTCNSNGVRDDNWDVEFDGNYIGTVDIDTNNFWADVMLPSSFSAYPLAAAIYSPCVLVKTRYDSAYLNTVDFVGSHVLKLTCTQINGLGNFFELKAIRIQLSGGSVDIISSQTLTSVSGTYILGDVLTRNINISQC
jgi:hypothetical protein